MVATDAEYSDVELDEYDAIREEDSLEKSENVTKFQTAADIVNRMFFSIFFTRQFIVFCVEQEPLLS
jgi:hypothetical protein